MRLFIKVLLVLAVAVWSGLGGCANSDEARWNRLTKDFVKCVPDTIPKSQREEIAGLLDVFFTRAKAGEVYDEDIAKIETKMRTFIDGGWIDPDTLAHFMALVGYSSYRKDPRYNLPERIVDHPTLNPDAAIVLFGRDSTGPRAQLYYKVPGADSTADTTKADTTKAPSK